jgi:hypothetical protein
MVVEEQMPSKKSIQRNFQYQEFLQVTSQLRLQSAGMMEPENMCLNRILSSKKSYLALHVTKDRLNIPFDTLGTLWVTLPLSMTEIVFGVPL